MKNLYSLFIIIFFFLISCSNDEPDYLSIEKKEQQEKIESVIVSFYKGTKVSLRTIPIVSHADSNVRVQYPLGALANATHIHKFGISMMDRILLFEGQKEKPSELSITETFQLYKEFNSYKDALASTDEDVFPSLSSSIMWGAKSNTNAPIKEVVSASTEHVILSLMFEGLKAIPFSFQLYEIEKANFSDFTEEQAAIANIWKGYVYNKGEWYYSSEKELTTAVNWSDNKDKEIHVLACLGRGGVRLKMDTEEKKKLALEDLELFLKDAEDLGMPKDLCASVEAYIAIKQEQPERAMKALEVLKQSENLSAEEKASIGHTQEYLKNREDDKLMNGLWDKLFIVKLGANYFYKYVQNTTYYKNLHKDGSTKQMENVSKVLETESTNLKKAEDILSTEKQIENVKNLF